MDRSDRIPAPRLPEAPPPYRFPLVATIAPVVASVAIWLLTSSPFALVFAALGPLTAVASLADARLGSRRTARREAARFAADADAVRSLVRERHAIERAELEEAAPAARAVLDSDPRRWSAAADEPVLVALGVGTARSRTVVETPAGASGDVASTLRGIADEADVLERAPIVVDARLGIGIVGPEPLAAAVARAVSVGIGRVLSPGGHWCARSGDPWMPAPPHPGGPAPAVPGRSLAFGARDEPAVVALVAIAQTEDGLPPGCRIVVRIGAEGGSVVRHPDRDARRPLRCEVLSLAQAARWTSRAAEEAARAGMVVDGRDLPSLVPLAPLLEGGAGAPLECTPAIDAAGPVTLDLVAQGPHAIVGGTTGSGKSELLVSWVLAMAAAHPPDRVTFLLVDFKGGAAFAPLRRLPHTVGIVTDLDEAGAARALASLRAELRHRERRIVDAGARDIEQIPGLPRLVIIVDEFAAMIAEQPDLHAVFADLAARGRALGVHLVLCTQRPTGVVRDAVLANADLRISLRVNNRADSAAIVGSDAAASLPPEARGRAVLALAGAEPRIAQFALASAADVDAVIARWPGAAPPRRPWLEPLPALVTRHEVDSGGFALVDLPDEQRRATATWGEADGHVLVLGAARSGKSTALAALAAGSAEWIPRDPAAAWDAIARLETAADRVVVLDDADSVLARLPTEYRTALGDRLGMLLRDGPRRGIRFAIAAQRLTADLQPLSALMPSRLYLAHSSRQEIVLAGGEAADFRTGLPPGGGSWRGDRVQVVAVTVPSTDEPPRVAELGDGPIALVTHRPSLALERLGGRGVPLGDAADPVAAATGDAVIVADPEEWQSRWGAIAALRPVAQLLFDGCSTAEFRALTRLRELPPPIDGYPALCWRLEPDSTVVRVPFPA